MYHGVRSGSRQSLQTTDPFSMSKGMSAAITCVRTSSPATGSTPQLRNDQQNDDLENISELWRAEISSCISENERFNFFSKS